MNHGVRLLLAVVLTFFFTQSDVRYETLGHFSPSPWAADVRLHSRPNVAPTASGGWRLVAADAKAHPGVSWTWAVPPQAQAVRVQAQVGIRDVTQGEKYWERASVALRQLDAQNKPRERSVFGATGTLTESVDEVQVLLPETVSVQLMVRLLRASGSMEVRDLQLRFVAQREAVGWALLGVWLVWLWGFVGLGQVWLRGARNRWLPVLGMVLVLCAVTLPGAGRDVLAHWLVSALGLPKELVFHPGVSVAVHGLMFALASALLARNQPDWSRLRCWAELGLLVVCSEAVQRLVPGRDANGFDIAVDLVGVSLGLLLLWAWRDAYPAWQRWRARV